MKRGEVYRFNLEPIIGHEQKGVARPCLIISADELNEELTTINVIPLTTSPKPLFPLVVPLSSLNKPNASALPAQIRALDKSRIRGKSLGAINDADLMQIEIALKIILQL